MSMERTEGGAPLRVLHLINSSGFFGAENVVLQLATQLTAMGHDVTVGVFKDSRGSDTELATRAAERGIGVRIFACDGRSDFGTAREIGAVVRAAKVDVVHSHGYKANLYARVARFPRDSKRVSTSHNWIDSSRKMRFYNRLDRLVLRGFDAVVAVSGQVRTTLERAGVKPEKIFDIGNGVDTDLFRRTCNTDLRAALGLSGARVVGTIGRLGREKGHACLLDAAQKVVAELPDVRFLIVGDGVLRQELAAHVANLGIADKVVFAGKRDDIPDLLSVMDVFVLPSLLEGHPMALLEAMAARRAVIATSVGEVPRIIANAEQGIVIPPGDRRAIARAIMELLQDDRLRHRIAENAHARITQHYSARGMARAYERVYRSLVGRERERPGICAPASLGVDDMGHHH